MQTLYYDLQTLPQDRWQALCAVDPQATIFHSTDWSRLWEKSRPRARAEWLVVADDDDNWQGGLPLVRFSRIGIDQIYSQPLGSYGGWLGPQIAEISADIAQLFDGLKKVNLAEMVFTPLYDTLPDLYPGRRVERRRFVLDFAKIPAGQSWRDGLRDDIGRNLHTAERHEWTIIPVNDQKTSEQTYPLWQQTAIRHKRLFDDARWAFYLGLPECLTPEKQLFWWTVADTHGPAATMICFYSGDRMFYYDGAMDLTRKNARPTYALFATALDAAARLGCRYFDFGSGPTAAQGLERFKKGWGGVPETYAEYHFRRFWFPRRLR